MQRMQFPLEITNIRDRDISRRGGGGGMYQGEEEEEGDIIRREEGFMQDE